VPHRIDDAGKGEDIVNPMSRPRFEGGVVSTITAAFWLCIALSAAVEAATITVNSVNQVDPGQCTIATAIASMNAASDQPGCTHAGTYGTSDTINLAATTYALTVADNGTNAFPIVIVALTIEGNGATLSRTNGAVAPFFRFFEVASGGLTLNNATLTGGDVPNGNGGALLIDSGPLSIGGSTFSANSAPAGDGGAIYHNSIEAAIISNSTFTGNSAPNGDGGAVYDNSSNGLTLTSTTFSGNSANNGDGGAVYDNSIGGLSITNSSFDNNSATAGDGGAIYDNSSNGLVFNGGSVTNNTVSPGGDGGGIYDNSGGGINITNVVFTGNSASGGDGGAIYDFSSSGTGPVSNNCIVGNTATISGGGIFRGSTPALNAVNNWWGAATGPSEAGSGTGDAASTNVTFAPFLASAPVMCGGGPSAGTLQFSVPTYSVGEGGVNATITVARVGGTSGAIGVTFGTSDGSATAGSDYTTANGTLSWADADGTSKTFVVAITDDALSEGNETVNLILGSPTGGATLGTPSTAILTIIDNDSAIAAPVVPVPTLSQWALAMLGLLMLGGAMAWRARR
jgi:predicted outer membrane repeat protein